jgi:hypothetical protein
MVTIKGENYKERCNNQLNEWVKGNSIHNEKDNECCPDFSCCKKDCLQPKEVRETFSMVFKKASEETFNPNYHPYEDKKMEMLMCFLGGAFSDKKNVYVTDGNTNYKKDLN